MYAADPFATHDRRAGAACDLLAVLQIAENQDQKIAACGSSYGRLCVFGRSMPNTVITGIVQIFLPPTVGVGAGAACDLLAVLQIAQNQDQKIAACGSSYEGNVYPQQTGRPVGRLAWLLIWLLIYPPLRQAEWRCSSGGGA
ncbi:hypothetical protein [Pseudomonas fluorescens]|uniref:hypothetical protein n=1 Tax=Pseudomonas fluorescens TaxID=294 RepID=UPI00177ABB94|nr:hypothetical protein [Pseudomonas fluorescens]